MAAETSFGLAVQRLPTTAAVLALAELASWRNDDRWFRTSDVVALYDSLRIPQPANLSAVLGRLRDRQSYVRDDRSGGAAKRWTVTPEGEHQAETLIGDFDYGTIAAELQAVPGAFFAHAEYPTLPPSFAPPGWAPGIKSFLNRHPFEQNVFLMTRFPEDDAEADPLSAVIDGLRDTVAKRGLTLHVASDQQIVDHLWGNVGAHMWACRYGIGILETRAPRPPLQDNREDESPDPRLDTLNDNVLIELGSMLTIGRRCMILRDGQAPMPPTDLTSHIFKTVKLEDLDAVAGEADQWIAKDLRLA